MTHVPFIKPPSKVNFEQLKSPVVFLGGSIDQGTTEDWQDIVTKKYTSENITFLNPRRADWNPNASEVDIRQQIYWELDALEGTDAIIIYFHPDSKAPISLLELGLFCRQTKVVVVCPPGYWRKTNVEVVCERYGVEITEDLDDGMQKVIQLAKQKALK
jgi:hypothetical protein